MTTEKELSGKPDAQIAGVEHVNNTKLHDVQVDHELEHRLTLKQVFRGHPALVWWCFYWAMAAVGW